VLDITIANRGAGNFTRSFCFLRPCPAPKATAQGGHGTMTKRHRQLLAHKAELESRRTVLTKEGQTIGDTAEQEKRQFTAGERKRRDDILAELDEIKSRSCPRGSGGSRIC
jgi:hypothetical protein